jgi:hypothetical protein
VNSQSKGIITGIKIGKGKTKMKSTLYANRETINLIHKLISRYGKDRVAQTNSRHNGNFTIVRIYRNATDKGKPSKAMYTITKLSMLRQLANEE